MDIIRCYYADGSVVTDKTDIDHQLFSYAQITLDGNHAKKADDGNIMVISASDYEQVVKFKWYLNSAGYPSTYGTHDGKVKFGRPVPFHQLFIGRWFPGLVVDHINRNKLDNRRENLRICTAVENSYNKSKPKNSNRTYKGVKKVGKKSPTYTASITKDGVTNELKGFASEKEAALAYDMMAEELFGEFAAKNFPVNA